MCGFYRQTLTAIQRPYRVMVRSSHKTRDPELVDKQSSFSDENDIRNCYNLNRSEEKFDRKILLTRPHSSSTILLHTNITHCYDLLSQQHFNTVKLYILLPTKYIYTEMSRNDNEMDEVIPIHRNSSTGNLSTQRSSNRSPLSPWFVRAIFLLLGVGTLIPWNAYVSAKPYFLARFCQDNGHVLLDFELWFGIIWNVSSVLSLGLIIASVALQDYFCKRNNYHSQLQHDEHLSSSNDSNVSPETSLMLPPTSPNRSSSGVSSNNASDSANSSHHVHDNPSPHDNSAGHSFWLVILPLSIYLLVFASTNILVLFRNISPELFLILTMTGLAICGTCSAIATAGIISTASLFESHVGITPFFSGQSLGGVAVSFASFVAASMGDPKPFWDHTCTSSSSSLSMSPQSLQQHSYRTSTYSETSLLLPRTLAAMLNQDGEDDDSTTCSPYTTIDYAVFAYFLAGCIVLACCIAGFLVITIYHDHNDGPGDYQPALDAAQEQQQQQDTNPNIPVVDDQSPRIGLELSERLKERSDIDAGLSKSTHSYQGSLPGASYANSNTINEEPMISTVLEEFTDEEVEEEEVNEATVFFAIQGPATCTFLVFTVTLCLFPSWISQLRSIHECQSHSRFHNDLYVPASFVLFNVGDLIGRLLANQVPVDRIPRFSTKLVLAALSRLLFLPLFLMCVTETEPTFITVIPSDLFSSLVQLTFAITNGLLLSCSFMHAPSLVPHSAGMQERASEMMTFAISFGLLSGSLLSFPFMQVALRL